MKEYVAEQLHSYAIRNRKDIESSNMVGCFGCCRIYEASKVAEWTDGGQTAICDCWIDAVIADSSFPVPITKRLLTDLQNYFF